MHWLVGIAVREAVLDRVAAARRSGWSGRGSRDAGPRLPNLAYGPEWTGERSLA